MLSTFKQLKVFSSVVIYFDLERRKQEKNGPKVDKLAEAIQDNRREKAS